MMIGLDYLRIILGTMLVDTFCGIAILVLYLLTYSIANNDFSFDRNFEVDLGIYTLASIILVIGMGYLMERYIVRRFLCNFARCKIPFQNLFRTLCVMGFVWMMYTYSVQERFSIIWLHPVANIYIEMFH